MRARRLHAGWADSPGISRARRGRILLCALCIAATLSTPVAAADIATDTPQARLQSAERLFDLPVYRQLATRQLYDALATLPEAQYERAVEAIRNPRIVQAVRAVIVRSMAQTYTVKELDFLARVLTADEARILVDKTDAFRTALMRELLSAAVTNPELGQILLPQ